MGKEYEYLAFCDESYVTASRFRSISVLSFRSEYYKVLTPLLSEKLRESNINEFKWNKLRTVKYYFCAEGFIDLIFSKIAELQLRIDILTWDTKDRRHKIVGRDDRENFCRMFYHLINNTIRRREASSNWKIYTDEKSDANWGTIEDCLKAVGRRPAIKNIPMIVGEKIKQNYVIDELSEIDSSKNSCVQLADFFAGLAVFSINNYDKYKRWEYINSPQFRLFETSNECKLSNSEKIRFRTLKYFIDQPKRKKLEISFDTEKKLYTPNPNNPINFWHYRPQHEKDIAPRKK